MARKNPRSLLAYLFILLPLLFTGCAAGPQLPAGKTTTDSPVLQKALDASEVQDYGKAVINFERELQQHGELSAQSLYLYGLALSRTGDYAGASKYLSMYLDQSGKEGEYIPQARHERFLAERSLAEKQAAAALARELSEKATLAKMTAEQLGSNLKQGQLTVKNLLAAQTPAFQDPVTGIEMVLIPGGCFQMGDQFGDGEANERPLHEACVDSFYLSKHEITQGQWQTLMGYNPSAFPLGDDYPVEMVSWAEAQTFASNLSGATGSYRLPTEAEWEYAARSGGKKEKFSGSDLVDAVAWHEDNANDSPQPVGRKQPNGLGLHDMSGNVYEWCQDRYAADYYHSSPKQNPAGPTAGDERVRRGGSWDSEVSYSRSSYRDARHESEYRANYTGFRLALPVSR